MAAYQCSGSAALPMFTGALARRFAKCGRRGWNRTLVLPFISGQARDDAAPTAFDQWRPGLLGRGKRLQWR